MLLQIYTSECSPDVWSVRSQMVLKLLRFIRKNFFHLKWSVDREDELHKFEDAIVQFDLVPKLMNALHFVVGILNC